MEEIYGYIERITFFSTETGFTVARLKEPKKRDLTTIVGLLSSLQAGETIRCKGFWKTDSKYGFQFEVKDYRTEYPATVNGISKYLGSGLIKGIGSVYATRIVEKFGTETLNIIEDSPDELLYVPGIGSKRLESIKKSWQEQKSIREVMIFLQNYGVNPSYSQKIFKTYGDESIEKVQENPYLLARDIYGIGFKTADSIARKMGIEMQADIRIDSGVEYVLSKLAEEGHTCYPVETFLKVAQTLLEVEEPLIEARLQWIKGEKRIIIEEMLVSEPEKNLMPFVWLKVFHVCEQGIAAELKRIGTAEALLRPASVERSIAEAEHELEMTLADNQKKAIGQALSQKIHLITGGPGTGKSTITRVILAIAQTLTDKIILAAPTGRAAKRLSTVTGREAKTIHALLEYDFKVGGFKKNREQPLDAELIIIDEASMIDTVLMYSLLKAAPNGAKFILIGDTDQLPSVGAGNVLSDLIDSGKIPFTRLTDIFRQAASSKIITNAHAINKGQLPDTSVKSDGDFFFIKEEDPEKIASLICDLVAERLPKKYNFDRFDEIQVLSPMKRGVVGTHSLNLMLQQRLNPSDQPLIKMGKVFHTGDKVMQIQNDYEKMVFNGDVGRITRIDQQEQVIIVNMDGRDIIYEFSDLDQLVLAYAVSVHKYQGSECTCVIMPVHTTHYNLLFRNLIYTGITRGKKLVVVIGTARALSIAVKNNEVQKRYTGLKNQLAVNSYY